MNKDLEKVLQDAITNSIWRSASVTIEPEVRLTQWRVFLVKADLNSRGDTIHFVGYTGYEGRVCSAVQTYDPINHCGVTNSGRIYELVGDPGFNSDAMWVWSLWLERLGNPEVEDISESYRNQNV